MKNIKMLGKTLLIVALVASSAQMCASKRKRTWRHPLKGVEVETPKVEPPKVEPPKDIVEVGYYQASKDFAKKYGVMGKDLLIAYGTSAGKHVFRHKGKYMTGTAAAGSIATAIYFRTAINAAFWNLYGRFISDPTTAPVVDDVQEEIIKETVKALPIPPEDNPNAIKWVRDNMSK